MAAIGIKFQSLTYFHYYVVPKKFVVTAKPSKRSLAGLVPIENLQNKKPCVLVNHFVLIAVLSTEPTKDLYKQLNNFE